MNLEHSVILYVMCHVQNSLRDFCNESVFDNEICVVKIHSGKFVYWIAGFTIIKIQIH